MVRASSPSRRGASNRYEGIYVPASSHKLGYVFIILSAISYSMLGIIARYIYNSGLEMQLVTLMRFVGTVILLGIFWLFDRKRPLMTLSPAVLFQGLFFVASAVLYFFAVKHLSAGLATVILFAHPALVALLAAIVYRERISRRQIAGIALALLGLLFISGLPAKGAAALSPLGIGLSIGCAVVYGIYVLLGQHTTKKDSPLTITFTLGLMGLVIVCLMFPSSIPRLASLTPYQVFLGFGMALVGTVLSVVLLLKGVKLIGASVASLVSISEIPFSLVLAFLILGEVVTPLQILGTMLIIVATIVAMTVRKQAVEPERVTPFETAESAPRMAESQVESET